jgi:excisionase family DNA binding protein
MVRATQINSEDSLYDWSAGAAFLNITERHLKRLWAERRISGSKIGRFVRFSREDLDDYIGRNHVEARQ